MTSARIPPIATSLFDTAPSMLNELFSEFLATENERTRQYFFSAGREAKAINFPFHFSINDNV